MKKNKKIEIDAEQRKKEGKPIKDIIPPITDKSPREPYVNQTVDNFSRVYKCESEPYNIPPEWPGDEVAKVFKFI